MSPSRRGDTVQGERKVREPCRSRETATRHPVVTMLLTRTRNGPSPTQELTVKRRLATLSIVSAMLALAAQPAFAGTYSIGI